MEDAAAKLAGLAADVESCTRCAELVPGRIRAVAGRGRPHAHVLVVAPHPSELDEADEQAAAGASLLTEMAGLAPRLAQDADGSVYVTALVKCVPRSGGRLRDPLGSERDACFAYLSAEISTITPHLLVLIGRETSAFVLQRLFGRAVDSALPPALQVLESPSFRVLALASPSEMAAMPDRERERYVEQVRALAGRLGL